MSHDWSLQQATALKDRIRQHGRALGFGAVGFAPVDLGPAEARLAEWLDRGYHGDMDYMARHGSKRARPEDLLPKTRSVISVRLDYLPGSKATWIADPEQAAISVYAQGRDYHKVLRNRLQTLAELIGEEIGPYQYRAFTDSAPVMEVELARLAGLGWRGKHTLLLSRQGSWFFLGELYTDLPLPPDDLLAEHCGTCQACMDLCPTQAIIAPYLLDARRCISYLTIELAGPIPEPLRPLLGNRIYGCDDCQLACPWNRYATTTAVADFLPRQGLDHARLVELFAWSEAEFNDRLAGSAIRRIGHERWLRNIAVALGNAPDRPEVIAALETRQAHPSELVREHVQWALQQHRQHAVVG
jgi:epoxyqueuosine reductase